MGVGEAALDWRLNPGGHAQSGKLGLSLPSVMINVKKVKTEETTWQQPGLVYTGF